MVDEQERLRIELEAFEAVIEVWEKLQGDPDSFNSYLLLVHTMMKGAVGDEPEATT